MWPTLASSDTAPTADTALTADMGLTAENSFFLLRVRADANVGRQYIDTQISSLKIMVLYSSNASGILTKKGKVYKLTGPENQSVNQFG